MNTIIDTHKTYHFGFDHDEVHAIKEVYSLINDIQDVIGDEATIISQTTGELIEADFLSNMNGVLEALLANNGKAWDEFN